MPWYQSKPHIWRNFLAKFEISLHTQENFSKYVVWIGTKAYIWRSYYLENFKKIVYQDLQIYALVPLQTKCFRVFVVISQIRHIEIRPNSHRLSVLELSYYLQSFKKIVYQDLNICALVPLQTTYLEIFSCVCSDISNLAHRNSSKLAQIIRIIDILLSGEFQENRKSGSIDICLGTTPNHIFGDIFCVCSDIANLAHRNSPKLAQIIRHIYYLTICRV